MSFILDALKKSESDRQRHSGPALFEVRVAPPRTGLPPWAIAVVALLVVNLGVVMWMLLRHRPAAAVPSAAPGIAAAPAAQTAAASAAAPAAQTPAASPTLAPASTAPASATAGSAAPGPSLSFAAPALAGAAASSGPPPALPVPPADSSADGEDPQDYAPATEQPGGTGGVHVRRATAEGVPLYHDAPVTASLPPLHLDLHVYAARPADRFVMINMHKLRQGEMLPDGVRVDDITPDGAVLSYNGSRFLLPRE
ncbi:MAG: general secretion pathway protein GspB [Proteobacteria bacterium]|nr:general secretion pathway protein GspB [Pseudomonadota bacterium]